MSDLHYLYCFARPDCSVRDTPEAMDERFAVERFRCGPVAAITSRVETDRFDVSKLQEEPVDVTWVSQAAVRHNAVVDCLAQRHPVLPLRLGTVFNSRLSLLARTADCAGVVAGFLRRLGDRQEWAVKLYLDEGRAMDYRWPAASDQSGHSSAAVQQSSGTRYFAVKRQGNQRRRQLQDFSRQESLAVESCLTRLTDSWQRLRPLSTALTGRAEKMLWNAAFLIPRHAQESFRAACTRLREVLNPKGLVLEVTGPWAPYHFCPTLAPSGAVVGSSERAVTTA